jgi:hypothetical protein
MENQIVPVSAFEPQIVKYGESQSAMPVLRSRSITGIMAVMEREFAAYPEIAESFFYARPVGGGKVATGLSIRCAEFMANYYPNSAYTTEIVGEDEDSITICATFRDEELNTSHSKTVKMSKWFKYKDGRVEKSDPDRLEIRIAAFTSKALREVVLRSMPVSLKMNVESRAKEIIGRKLMEPESIKKLLGEFLKFGLEQKHLEKIIGKATGKMDTEDRIFMLSLHNSIADGEFNVKELIEICSDPKVRNIRLAISDLMTGNPLGGGTKTVDLDNLGNDDDEEKKPEKKHRGRPPKDEKKEQPGEPIETPVGTMEIVDQHVVDPEMEAARQRIKEAKSLLSEE